ncbi:hydrogen peroxide-inducible genes activator [Flavobacteriaceae bacterium]|jgi:LysR family hydrogen peroxide-inducible transcriptional activator|nr:hydrogen peroxide-inducible genes activator [Flavobacteriaceae bacterium]MBT5092309.1 hydrogen peroxide-inducible genes activator [Flavobacteriaceae bacterium]MBT5445930.1 hydrogen peroxide-inducible genes activator [Flavobacteriaceae bacterium]MBT5694041.1 hydrogen peroxide-inducible genes activator [Flavobacteriaceae bacterium]MBT5974505.1 hydrogen peroxide-inducible genes activator [Flavobacteriaceae bacterium]|tara:strand:- start:2852 stop:3778 length:927 start_codon:yes stop_codon:yes gene_type:complete
MTLTQLQYTIAVAEEGNFTQAAEKCFVTQPTLSMQVQKLEDELGIKLFNRNTKPITLTTIGEKIIDQAKMILKEANRMEDIVSTEKGFVGGNFRLGIIPTVMPTLLPMFLNTFIKKFPKVNLKIEELNTAAIIEELKNGKLDAGIAATPLDDVKIIEKPLYYEPFVGYIPEPHPLSKLKTLALSDLEKMDVLVLEDGHCFRDHVLKICQTPNFSHTFNLKSGSFETLIHLANDGLGMTLLPYLQTRNLTPQNAKNLRSFESPEPAREISLIYSKSQLKLPIIESLSATIESLMRGAIKFDNIKVVTPN